MDIRRKPENYDFGKKVTAIRKEQGLTQADIAVAMNFTNKSSVGKIENGNQDVTLAEAYRYAKALNIPLPELLQIGDDPTVEYLPFLKSAEPEVIFCVRKLLNMPN